MNRTAKPLPFRTTEKIYQVMYSRASTRKFKKWECDGFLIYKFDEYFNGDDSCLSLVKKLDSGKQPLFENRSLDLADKEREFEPGHQCCMGGYDLEIQELLKKVIKQNKQARQRPVEEEDSDDDGNNGERYHVADELESDVGKSDVANFFPNASTCQKGRLAETGFVRPSLSMPVVPAPTPRELTQKRKRNNEPLRLRGNRDNGVDISCNFSFDSVTPLDPNFAQDHEGDADDVDVKKQKVSDPVRHAIARQLPVDLTENLTPCDDGGTRKVFGSDATRKQKDSPVCGGPFANQCRGYSGEDSPDFIPASQGR